MEFSDTILNEAVRYSDLSEVQAALDSGYDPNQIGLYKWSSLHEACSDGELEIVGLLIDRGGDPTVVDKLKNNTSFHYAAKEGRLEILKLLLEKSRNWNIKNANGDTPYDIATSDCKKLFEKYGFSTEITKNNVSNLKEDDVDSAVHSMSGDDNHRLSISLNSGGHALGFIELSFEYNSKKKTFKIRVWRVTDIILPPADVSTINTISVKSCMIPDLKRSSKRKTEDVKVQYGSETMTNLRKPGSIKPSIFEFTKALEYKDIDDDVIKAVSIEIHVTVCQRLSLKDVSIGKLKIDAEKAVKQLIRKKYLLTAIPSKHLPTSMRVYSSIPNLRSSSLMSLVNNNDKAVSENNFNVRSISVTRSLSTASSVEIPIMEDEENDEILTSINVESNQKSKNKKYKNDASIKIEEEEGENGLSVPNSISIHQNNKPRDKQLEINMPINLRKNSLPSAIITKADVHRVRFDDKNI